MPPRRRKLRTLYGKMPRTPKQKRPRDYRTMEESRDQETDSIHPVQRKKL